MNLIYIFANFLRIGLFSIGGGLATLPFLFEIADNISGINADNWLTRELIGNMLAVAQSLPGPIGSNISTYAGYVYAGIPGGYIASLGLVVPSIVIIILVARTLEAFKESITLQNIFSGFRPAAAGLLSAAGFGAISLSLYNGGASIWYEYIKWKESLVFIVIFILILKFKKHPIAYIAVAGAAGIILQL